MSDVAVVVVTVAIGTGALVTPVLVGVDVGAEVGHHEHLGLTCSGGAPLSGHVTTWWTERKTRAAIYSLVYNVKACQIHYLYVQLRLGFYTAYMFLKSIALFRKVGIYDYMELLRFLFIPFESFNMHGIMPSVM